MSGNGLVGYFGYGSLVNRRTLLTDYVDVFPAKLRGWRRHWQSRGLDRHPNSDEPIALLSIHPHREGILEGMLVVDRESNLAAVDRREARYDRQRVEIGHIDLATPPEPHVMPEHIYVYVGRAFDTGPPPKLLQSYLDTVMTGYLDEFGEAGLAGFLETTIGFDRAIVRDRDRPIYSRAVAPSPELAERFDRLLRAAGVRYE